MKLSNDHGITGSRDDTRAGQQRVPSDVIAGSPLVRIVRGTAWFVSAVSVKLYDNSASLVGCIGQDACF